MNADEMRELLAREFGIHTDEELERELKKKGGIRIGIFTDKKPQEKETENDNKRQSLPRLCSDGNSGSGSGLHRCLIN